MRKWTLRVTHEQPQPFGRRHRTTDDLPSRQRQSTPADDMFLKVFLLLCIAVVLAECKPPSQRRSETSDHLPPRAADVQQSRWRRHRQRGDERESLAADTDDDEEEDIYAVYDEDDDDEEGDDYDEDGTTDRVDKGIKKSDEMVEKRPEPRDEGKRRPGKGNDGKGNDGKVRPRLDCVTKTDERNKWMQSGTCRNGRCS